MFNDFLKLALLGAAVAGPGGLLAPAAAGAAGAGAAGAGAAGAGAGGLLGAEGLAAGLGAAEGAGATTAAELLAAQEAGLGASSLGWGGATTGLQGGLNGLLGAETGASVGGAMGTGLEAMNTAAQYMKPVGTALNAASAAKGLFGSPQPPQMQPAQSRMNSAPLNLNDIIQQGQQNQQLDMQDQMRRRQQMQAYINSIGGR